MYVLRTADYKTMPWKNGGGVTTEIAVAPQDSAIGDFDWRVSMAQVKEEGPFSTFHGIDRTLSVLHGEGLSLEIEGKAPVRLTMESQPLSFPADAPTDATLISGAITDLNVMTRRRRCEHTVERVKLCEPVEIEVKAKSLLIFCLDGQILIRNETEVMLGPYETLVADGRDTALQLGPIGTATVFIIRIQDVKRQRAKSAPQDSAS